MKFSQPTPKLPMPDVRRPQEYYRDKLGFEIAWYNEGGKMGAVTLADCSIFFREVAGKQRPATFWVFCEDSEGAQPAFSQSGASIIDKLEPKPWGLRQFTVEDHRANKFYIFHDV